MNKLKILFYSCLMLFSLIGCSKEEDTDVNIDGSGSGTITGTTAKLHVEKAGSLMDLIPDDKKYTITDLTLTGEIDGSDIKLIREMAGNDVDGESTEGKLANLDISEVNIVTGGEPYYAASSSSTYSSKKNTISAHMFHQCNSLRNIKLPDNVTNIEFWSFTECTGVTSVTIGSGVTEIGGRIFSGCKGLIEIIVDANNSTYSSLDGVLFNKDQTTLIIYPEGKDGEYTIPNGVTSIGQYAFKECTGLTSIIIPNSVTEIGYSAFSGCTGLTSINIPNGVTEIGNYAFYECTGLTAINIPNSVTSIGEAAFRGCTGLREVHCLRDFPLRIDYNAMGYMVFDDTTKNEGTLYIPKGTSALYKKAGEWRDFKNIIEE